MSSCLKNLFQSLDYAGLHKPTKGDTEYGQTHNNKKANYVL